MDDDGDEYDAYNLSEFSATDFMYIDGTARQHEHDATEGARTPPLVTSESGGPQVAVALELAADESVVLKAARGSAEVEVVDAAQGLSDVPRRRAPRNRVDTRSPFEKYRSRGTLSVTDLVGPAWCVPIYPLVFSLTKRLNIILNEGAKCSLTMDSVRDGPSLWSIDLNLSFLPKERSSR